MPKASYRRKGKPYRSPGRSSYELSIDPGIVFTFPVLVEVPEIRINCSGDSYNTSPGSNVTSKRYLNGSPNNQIQSPDTQQRIINYPSLLKDFIADHKCKPQSLVKNPSTSSEADHKKPSDGREQYRSLMPKLQPQSSSRDNETRDARASPRNSVKNRVPPSLSNSHTSPIRNTPGKVCSSCHTRNSTCWRPGWTRQVVLCNSCGLRFKKTQILCIKCNYTPLKREIMNHHNSLNFVCQRCTNNTSSAVLPTNAEDVASSMDTSDGNSAVLANSSSSPSSYSSLLLN